VALLLVRVEVLGYGETLDGRPTDESYVPYGLRLKHRISLPETSGLDEVAKSLLDLLRKLKMR